MSEIIETNDLRNAKNALVKDKILDYSNISANLIKTIKMKKNLFNRIRSDINEIAGVENKGFNKRVSIS